MPTPGCQPATSPIERDVPVYHLVGGRARDDIRFYCTGPDTAIKSRGFWGAKVLLPEGPHDSEEGQQRNVSFPAAQRAAIGPDFPLMVDCYMSLDVPYAIRLAEVCKPLDICWWEGVLSPDDNQGYRQIKRAHPQLKWTTGEHEYTRYGIRHLIAERNADVPNPM